MKMGDMFAQFGSILASTMFVWTVIQKFLPPNLKTYIDYYSIKVLDIFNPYIQITFNQFTGERLKRSEAYSTIDIYLSSNSSPQAKRLKGDMANNKNTESLSLTIDDYEEVADVYQGVKVWWSSGKTMKSSKTISFYPNSDERRYYLLKFHKKHKKLIIGSYLNHLFKEGKEIKARNRQRKLYTNIDGHWSHVVFEHPATFQTLAMESGKKQEIIDDLTAFSKAEEYYARMGRAWKRGYLLYGPPGTGKSSMIAAIANFLSYDIYDLELNSVKDNTDLRRLLLECSSKSIIVIEDIDCSVDLTGHRKKKVKEITEKDAAVQQPGKKAEDSNKSKITLSGLLNFIDGLWSCCGKERVIIFTTNHVNKLDPALIRRGRMDKHIELAYCGFDAFKVLANNYLFLESHELFGKIDELLQDTKMTPAEVAENIMPKTILWEAETCLESLIKALEIAREDQARKKSKVEQKGDDTSEDHETKEEEVRKSTAVEEALGEDNPISK